jgi:hypothetical protein
VPTAYRAFLAGSEHTFGRPSLDCSLSCRLIRAKVFPRSVWLAGVHLNCGERQDVCPFARVFASAESRELPSLRLTPRGRDIANLCNTSTAPEREVGQELASKSVVNFRYSGGCMHIALNAWMADSARSIKPTLIVGGPMFGFGRDKATECSRRRRSQELSMTADIDAKLPDRPSFEG